MSDTPPIKLYTALLAAMRDFGTVKKDRQNPAFRSSYATLHSILEAVEDPLHAQGLILVQRLVDDGGLALVTELIHAESGESI
ncbi:MAG: ERF family protein, partial [Gemmatimonadales bacterium]|nr:ERF family protein [Gemmatimonadales bacterium]